MVAPSAILILEAQAQLEDLPVTAIFESQIKEIKTAVPNKDDEFYEGYVLGMQTARVYLQGNLAAVQANIEL